MNKSCLLPIALALSTLAAAPLTAKACGEVMYRMGGALRYQAFVSRHPAEILLYSASDSARPEVERHRFHENLEKAGHKVTEISDEATLAKVLSERSFDVVITLASDVDLVTRNLAAASRDSTMIPVVDRNTAEEQLMRERFPQMVRSDANLNQVLKSIEQSMKARGT